MLLHGLNADPQQAGDIVVSLSLGDPEQDLRFPSTNAQREEWCGVGQESFKIRPLLVAAGEAGVERGHDLIPAGGFRQVIIRPQIHPGALIGFCTLGG